MNAVAEDMDLIYQNEQNFILAEESLPYLSEAVLQTVRLMRLVRAFISSCGEESFSVPATEFSIFLEQLGMPDVIVVDIMQVLEPFMARLITMEMYEIEQIEIRLIANYLVK